MKDKETKHTDDRHEDAVDETTAKKDKKGQQEPAPEQPTDEKTAPEEETPSEEEVDAQLDKYEELQDSYLRLRAEFDNYKKRTLREKADLMKYAAQRTLVTMLDVMDDFDRAVDSMDSAADVDAVKEGVILVRDKFTMALRSEGVHEMEVIGEDFDPELHEAVAMSDADDEHKGKIIDCVQKGYVLNDKVIRHPKVVVGK